MSITLTAEHKERIERWCQALESGRYMQGQKRLRDGDTFCCLGVGCDISEQGEWVGEGYKTGGGIAYSFMPDSVCRYFGLTSFYALSGLLEDGAVHALTVLNDGLGYTFPEIAAALRRTYLKESR